MVFALERRDWWSTIGRRTRRASSSLESLTLKQRPPPRPSPLPLASAFRFGVSKRRRRRRRRRRTPSLRLRLRFALRARRRFARCQSCRRRRFQVATCRGKFSRKTPQRTAFGWENGDKAPLIIHAKHHHPSLSLSLSLN